MNLKMSEKDLELSFRGLSDEEDEESDTTSGDMGPEELDEDEDDNFKEEGL